MTETSRDPRAGWTQWEKEEFDARADHEEWSHACSILSPMAAISREVGNASLSKVIDKAVGEIESEVARARAVWEALAPPERATQTVTVS